MNRILLFVCLFLIGSAWAQDQNASLREKVTDALKFSLREANFSATARISDNIVKYSRMHDPSGGLLLREEIYDSTGQKLIVTLLENRNGYFQIDDAVGVLKNEKPGIPPGGYINYAYNAGGMLTNCRNGKYEEQEIFLRGIPCYKITLSLNATPEELSKWLLCSIEHASKEENQIVYIEYIIGKITPFVYAVSRYNKSGNKIPGGIEFTNVKLNPQFPSSLFEPPPGIPIKVVKTQKEADELFTPKNHSNGIPWGDYWNRIENTLFASSNFLSWFFAGVGAICVGIVLWLKLRERIREK